jgi:cyclic pyranopterin phosphate synthase
MSKFSHLDSAGQPNMVDVGEKVITTRVAIAEATIELPDSVIQEFDSEDLHTKKGSVIQTAMLAGIMGAKQTSMLIPLCHPLPLDKCHVEINRNGSNTFVIRCTARTTGKTGVEMEALTGASIAALTFYDMCKAFSHDIVIHKIQLIAKSGGKRDFNRDNQAT